MELEAPFFFFPLTVAESSTFRPPASKSAATIVLKPTTPRATKRKSRANSFRATRGPRTNKAQLRVFEPLRRAKHDASNTICRPNKRAIRGTYDLE